MSTQPSHLSVIPGNEKERSENATGEKLACAELLCIIIYSSGIQLSRVTRRMFKCSDISVFTQNNHSQDSLSLGFYLNSQSENLPDLIDVADGHFNSMCIV